MMTFFEEARECIEICADLHNNQARIEKWLENFYEFAYQRGFEEGSRNESGYHG
jgi:flagellar biosynthesis/type III secretory pathway protein FliH